MIGTLVAIVAIVAIAMAAAADGTVSFSTIAKGTNSKVRAGDSLEIISVTREGSSVVARYREQAAAGPCSSWC